MFRLKQKNLIFFSPFIFILLVLTILISPLKHPILNILKHPLELFTLVGREVKALIFFHPNYIQNVKLKKEIDLLNYKLNLTNEAYLENMRLRNLLSFKKTSPLKLIAARVIGRSPDSWTSTIIIDRGQDNGIKKGFIAITPLGLAGKVVETTASVSKIMLVNDPNFSVSAIDQRSRQEGLVTGTLGNSLLMKYLPKDADIKVSDVVLTSGLTATYPKGLIIGTVIEVAEEFSGLSRYAILKPAVNLNLEEVLVIIQ